MKSFLSKLTGGRLKVKRSPLDVTDFLNNRSMGPSYPEIMAVVERRFADSEKEAQQADKGVYGAPTEAMDVEISKRRMYFDLRYRCGARGRCLDGTFPCRFPNCFDCRPVMKGQEVFSERISFELGNSEHPLYREAVADAAEDRLEDALVRLNEVIRQKEQEARAPIVKFVEAQQKTQGKAAEVVSNEEMQRLASQNKLYVEGEEKVKLTPTGMPFGVRLIDELIAITSWKTTLLVNLERDEQAVDCALRLAKLLPKEYKPAALGLAASWGVLNDLEVLFYRSHCKAYPDYKPTKEGIVEKPMLLKKVVEACGDGELGDYYLDHCVHAVFSKEISAVISRAQGAQYNGDEVEDPISSSVVSDSVEYYRQEIGGKFWEKFHNLALMPPLPPSTPQQQHSQDASTIYAGPDTPQHVLDAVGRSMLLHHVAKSFERSTNEAKVADDGTVKRMDAEKERTLTRMRELLSVIRAHEMGMTDGPTVAEGKPSQPDRFKGK